MWFHTELLSSYYTPSEKNFLFRESTRDHWYILAPGNKGFYYELGETNGYVEFGELIFCPPGWTIRRKAPEPLEFLSAEFKWLDSEGTPFTVDTQRTFGRITIQDVSRLASTLRKFKEVGNSPFSDTALYRTHLLNDLLFLSLYEPGQAAPSKEQDTIIRNAIRYMEENAHRDISLQHLAHRAALSPSQFSRRFQSAVGLAPMQYVTQVRLQKASHLLLETDLLIEQVASECGYQNGFYFSRVFSKAFGLSPSQFRAKNRV